MKGAHNRDAAAVLHSLQRRLKGKVVKIPKMLLTHNSRKTFNSTMTVTTAVWPGDIPNLRRSDIEWKPNPPIIGRCAFPSQVACPEHMVSLTSICYFLRKSYAEHSCKCIGSYNFDGLFFFMDWLQNDFGWFHGTYNLFFWVGSQITLTHDSFQVKGL